MTDINGNDDASEVIVRCPYCNVQISGRYETCGNLGCLAQRLVDKDD